MIMTKKQYTADHKKQYTVHHNTKQYTADHNTTNYTADHNKNSIMIITLNGMLLIITLNTSNTVFREMRMVAQLLNRFPRILWQLNMLSLYITQSSCFHTGVKKVKDKLHNS